MAIAASFLQGRRPIEHDCHRHRPCLVDRAADQESLAIRRRGTTGLGRQPSRSATGAMTVIPHYPDNRAHAPSSTLHASAADMS